MSILFALLSAVSAALVAIFAKVGLEHVDSTLATAIRSIVMAVVVVGAALLLGKVSGETLSAISSKAWFYIVLAGIAGALSWLFYFAAIQAGTTTTVVAIDKLAIVFVVLFAGLFLGEGFSLVTILGSLLMVAGALLIAFK